MTRQHWIGVVLFYCISPIFMAESHHNFTPKLVKYQLASGGRRWYIMGCYFAPDHDSTIDRIVMSIFQCPHRTNNLVAGESNTDLSRSKGTARDKDITAVLAATRLEYMLAQFLPCHKEWARDNITWSMVCQGRKVQYRMY